MLMDGCSLEAACSLQTFLLVPESSDFEWISRCVGCYFRGLWVEELYYRHVLSSSEYSRTYWWCSANDLFV